MKNSFDRILTSTPVDRQAAVVAGGKGEHWEPKPDETLVRSETPIKTRRYPLSEIRLGKPDLTGQTVGNLTVIGFHGRSKNGKSRWVVRCVCGAYELRRRKFIQRYHETYRTRERVAMCDRCDRAWKIRQPEYQRGDWK